MTFNSAPVQTSQTRQSPGPWVTLVGVVIAACCLGFAGVNIAFESLDRFADGPYAEYASGFTVMNWLVVGLKVIGAVVALLCIARQPVFVRPAVVGLLAWGAFATLAAYVSGSIVEAVGMATGLMPGASRIDLLDSGYVLFFLAFAAGFGVLATSYSRRHRLPKRVAVLGMLGPPVVLGGVLFAVPALLAAIGIMPVC